MVGGTSGGVTVRVRGSRNMSRLPCRRRYRAQRSGTVRDLTRGMVSTLRSHSMTDREKQTDKQATGGKGSAGADSRSQPQHPDLGERPDPDSQKPTDARPRGHTEEPDRTL